MKTYTQLIEMTLSKPLPTTVLKSGSNGEYRKFEVDGQEYVIRFSPSTALPGYFSVTFGRFVPGDHNKHVHPIDYNLTKSNKGYFRILSTVVAECRDVLKHKPIDGLTFGTNGHRLMMYRTITNTLHKKYPEYHASFRRITTDFWRGTISKKV